MASRRRRDATTKTQPGALVRRWLGRDGVRLDLPQVDEVEMWAERRGAEAEGRAQRHLSRRHHFGRDVTEIFSDSGSECEHLQTSLPQTCSRYPRGLQATRTSTSPKHFRTTRSGVFPGCRSTISSAIFVPFICAFYPMRSSLSATCVVQCACGTSSPPSSKMLLGPLLSLPVRRGTFSSMSPRMWPWRSVFTTISG